MNYNKMRNTQTIPRAPVARILIKAGAKRVSAPAVETFAEVINDIAEEIAARAAKIARHSGRKTVQEKDIKLAVR